jgi:hypothetical protein
MWWCMVSGGRLRVEKWVALEENMKHKYMLERLTV